MKLLLLRSLATEQSLCCNNLKLWFSYLATETQTEKEPFTTKAEEWLQPRWDMSRVHTLSSVTLSQQNSTQKDGKRVGEKEAKDMQQPSVRFSQKLPQNISTLSLSARTASIPLSSHKEGWIINFFPSGYVFR